MLAKSLIKRMNPTERSQIKDGALALGIVTGGIAYWNYRERVRKEFTDAVGRVGDVYRPYNKDRQQPQPFVFVRFETRAEMLEAMNLLQGKIIDGRKMEITEAKAAFELETSVY